MTRRAPSAHPWSAVLRTAVVRLALGAAVALASLAPAALAGAAEPVVILLSWDGVRHDYLDRARFPALERMQSEGLRAERLVPVFPSNTFPNHVALATGAPADRHGVVDNRFWDRERRELHVYSNDADWMQAEPLWAAAERQGVRAATFFWVGSETDWNGTGATYRRAPFDSDVGEAEKVAQILAWLDLPPDERPRLVMSWWHGADHAGHRKGPDHPDVVAALAEQDRHLGDLLAGLDARGAWPHATLLLVSDHGMTEVDTTLDAEAPLEEAGIEARVLWSSSYATVFLADPERVDDARRVLGGIEGVRVFRREEIPEAWRVRHPTRIGDLLVVTDPPRTFYQPSTVQSLLLGVTGLVGWRSGMHGYDPAHPDMGAVFLAMGRGVPEGRRTGAVRSLDVAPTVAKLLGIEPPRHAEGSALPALEWSAIAAIGPEPGAGGAAGRSVGAGDE